MRSIMTTSASRTPSARLWCSSAPKAASSRGTSVGGPTRRTVAPSVRSACRFERATRLWSTSPTIATVRQAIFGCRSRMVSRSSSACVGCSWQPSPAFRMGHETWRARRWQAPEEGWRTTIASGRMASRVRAVWGRVSPFHRPDLVHAVRLGEPDLHLLAAGGGEVLAHVVRADGKLAMAAVDEHRELHPLRPAEVDQRVHRGTHRSAGEEHVVDEEDAPPVDGERDVGPLHHRVLEAAVQVVAIERDVDHAEGWRHAALDLADRLADALGQVHATRADADQRQLLGALVALEDLVRDADERALDGERVHHLPAVGGHRRARDSKTPPRPGREASS